MLRLFLNTSNKYLYICLMDGLVISDEVLLEGNNNHSEKLIDVLKEFLEKNDLTIDNIDITTFNNTTFYFYSKGKITSGLENIYNKQLISKDELLEIKEYINNFSENNYIVTDYLIE